MSAESDVTRFRGDVQSLQSKVAAESGKVAQAREREARARQSAANSTSSSTKSSRLREAERESKSAIDAEKRRAQLEGQLADKQKSLFQAEARRSKEQAAEQDKAMKRLNDRAQQTETQFRSLRPQQMTSASMFTSPTENSHEAFIIMQIGNPEMDAVCDSAIVPAIEAAGLIARRVDRHNTGDLLKSEIVAFIERSDIIVADLTNERPNCYLEVGYAMGLGKKKNLILTAREDHHHGSASHVKSGPKIHFDLEGYDILLWDPEKLDDLKTELQKRIARRLAIVQTAIPGASPIPGHRPPAVVALDTEWRDSQRTRAQLGLRNLQLNGYMEVQVAISPHGDWSQQTLLQMVEASNIHTFGWPIGIVVNRDPYRPRPTAGGVVAEVSVSGSGDGLDRASYDYWSILRNGDFYMLKSLFEDSRTAGDTLFFDTRVVQTTELLMFLARLYGRLDVSPTASLRVTVKYGGLANRTLRAAGNRLVSESRSSVEDTIETTLECSLQDVETKLVENVKSLLEPVFMLFDFFELSDQVYADLVDNFVNGKIT